MIRASVSNGSRKRLMNAYQRPCTSWHSVLKMGGAVSEIWQRLWISTLKQLKVSVPIYSVLCLAPSNDADAVHIESSVNPSCEYQLADVNWKFLVF